MSIPQNSSDILILTWFAGIIFFLHTATGTYNSGKLYAAEGCAQTRAAVKNISAKRAREIMGISNDVFILDVRTKEEYNECHIKGANLIPIQDLEQNVNKIPKDKTVIVHCAKGKRSAKACGMLEDKGLKELYNMEGGINQWKAEGFPVEKPY
ncbi:MAG: hypothetical protein HBSAPP01_18340 [Candidatus Brocadia sapporoensis]|uniref:rhodanese-like domain-containing protein n=1 Tax=Candidatus Brocadia sapporoensis TaxID=392547 RepID=UPI0009B1E423|nr:rhodanese-like domain-containing protein [Candidatus Brocadia sapporoensis]MDG6004946.1 rhodanese-like domain-containing protein [Candidatus Brocadia sp.]GJQ24044.1 MAG: hypothetical protein HBSAPP01_18340 [Candidatus Brocadia sapporoensis]